MEKREFKFYCYFTDTTYKQFIFKNNSKNLGKFKKNIFLIKYLGMSG